MDFDVKVGMSPGGPVGTSPSTIMVLSGLFYRRNIGYRAGWSFFKHEPMPLLQPRSETGSLIF